MQRKDNDIVYLTLIDFLIQLIFFSLFIFVIFSNDKLKKPIAEPYSPQKWVNEKIYAPILEGFGPFIKAENVKKFEEIWKHLKTQQDLDNLLSALKSAKSTEELKKSADIVSKGGGAAKVEQKILGKKSCLENGSTASIFAFDAYDTYIKVKSISDVGAEHAIKRGLQLKIGDEVAKSTIGAKFNMFLEKDCVFFVDYIRHTDSEQMRHAVEQNFLIRRSGN